MKLHRAYKMTDAEWGMYKKLLRGSTAWQVALAAKPETGPTFCCADEEHAGRLARALAEATYHEPARTYVVRRHAKPTSWPVMLECTKLEGAQQEAISHTEQTGQSCKVYAMPANRVVFETNQGETPRGE